MDQITESTLPSLVEECRGLAVTDDVSYRIVAEKRGLVRQGIEYFTNLYKKRIEEAHKHHRNLIADRDKFVDQLKPLDKSLGQLLSAYDAALERKRLAKEAEARRVQKEKEDTEKRERDQVAELLRSAGADDEAEKIASKPVEQIKIVVPKETPEVEGLSYRNDWKADCVDLLAVVKAIAAGEAPIDAVQINQQFINSKATDLKAETMLWGGVKIFSVRTPVQRS